MTFFKKIKTIILKQSAEEYADKDSYGQFEPTVEWDPLFGPPVEEEKKEVKEKTLDEVQIDKREVFLKSTLKENLDGKRVYLIDFENTGKLPKTIFQDKLGVLLVFVGNNQKEAYKNHMKSIDCVARAYPIYSQKTGKNYLDNMLSLYVGMIVGRYSPEKIFIVSNDNDYALLHNVMKDSSIEFSQMMPNSQMANVFEPTPEYLNKIMKDISYKYPLGMASRKSLRKTISNSKIETIHPKVVDQILNKLEKNKFIQVIDKGQYQGMYKIKKTL